MSGKTWVIADPHFSHQGVCEFTRIDDPRYLCVSVEHTNWAPILLQDALKKVPQIDK